MPTKPTENENIRRFTCQHPGCGATYRRKEHLARHAIRHSQRGIFTCNLCLASFDRRWVILVDLVWRRKLSENQTENRRIVGELYIQVYIILYIDLRISGSNFYHYWCPNKNWQKSPVTPYNDIRKSITRTSSQIRRECLKLAIAAASKSLGAMDSSLALSAKREVLSVHSTERVLQGRRGSIGRQSAR